MRAAVFDRYGPVEVLDVREIPLPRPSDVLVRVCAAGVNPKDSFVRKGRFRRLSGTRFPQQSGYDFAGVVVESAVSSLQPGSPVFGMVNGWHGRTMAEYLACRRDELTIAPTTLALAQAAALPVAALTALQALRDHIRLKVGQRVLINGASGGVGSFALQIAKARGAAVTAVASAASANRCRALGADEVLNYAQSKLSDAARFEGLFDGVFDVFGNLSARRAQALLAPRGHFVTTVPSVANAIAALRSLLPWQRRRSSIVNVRSNAADLSLLADMVDRGALRVDIEASYGLEQVRDAHRHIEGKHTQGKVLVEI